MSSSAIPPSFNPHAEHPFTSGAPPTRTPATSIPIPSPHTTSPHRAPPRPATTSIPSQVAQSHANSFPTMQSPTARSAQRQPAQQLAQPIFTPFKPVRSSSPDSSDMLLKKRSPPTWPAQPSYPTRGSSAK